MSRSGKTGKLPLVPAIVALLLASSGAHAQPTIPAEHAGAASATRSGGAPYCPDLKQITALAATRGRFASIAGEPREGNFLDTTLPLTGWRSCALYGATTYTCDSEALAGADEAARAEAGAVYHIIACLGEDWVEDKERSAAGYVVVRPAAGPASITLSIDRDGRGQYLVRLTLFLRTGPRRE
jgi:hypothetical protein